MADESVDRAIVQSVREAGHDVSCVAETWPGISDSQVLSILLTGDKDLGGLVFRRGSSTEGVVLLRLSGLHQPEKASIALEASRRYAPRFSHAFTVIQPERVRVRRR